MTDSNDYASWHLKTNGGLKYRFLGMDGDFNPDGGTILWRALIRTQDLVLAAQEMFPPPYEIGGMSFPQPGRMPGFPQFVGKNIRFKSFEGQKQPIDPFNADTDSNFADSYGEFVEIEVEFGSSNKPQPNLADPRTFLEISADVGGEFIHAPSYSTLVYEEVVDEETGGPSVPLEDDAEDDADDQAPGGWIDNEGNLRVKSRETGEKYTIRVPSAPFLVLQPITNWTVTWRQIPYHIFRRVTVNRLRVLNGRVNSAPIPFLFNAPPETILFAGFKYTESYTWRDGFINTPPIDVEIKLVEKRVLWKGIVAGHNHLWYPGEGWMRVRLGDGSNPYRGFDFNWLFTP